MFGPSPARISILILTLVPAPANVCILGGVAQDAVKKDIARPADSQTGGNSYGDRNRGGPSGFYTYPRSRHVDRPADNSLGRGPLSLSIGEPSHRSDRNHGSAYYGRDYGAPYHGGGYYEGGTYYRERRDR